MLSEEFLNLKARNSELIEQIKFFKATYNSYIQAQVASKQLLTHGSDFIYLQSIPVQILLEDLSLINYPISDYCTCPESVDLYSHSGRLKKTRLLLNPLYRC